MNKTISRTGRDGRGGRPKTAEVEQRDEYILRVAGEAFLSLGFNATTMDAVANAARISKRTLYARYADKTVLFNAVLGDLISRWLIPIEQFQTGQGALSERLLALARYLTTFALTPQSIGVRRIIICESQRQPGFGRLANEAGRKPAIRAIVEILRQHKTELRPIDLNLAAEQLLGLVVDRNLRLADLGLTIDTEQIERWVCASIDLFLTGVQAGDARGAKRVAGPRAREPSVVEC